MQGRLLGQRLGRQWHFTARSRVGFLCAYESKTKTYEVET